MPNARAQRWAPASAPLPQRQLKVKGREVKGDESGRGEGVGGKWVVDVFRTNLLGSEGQASALLSPVHPAAVPGTLQALPWLDVPLSPWHPDGDVAVQPLFCRLEKKKCNSQLVGRAFFFS